MAQDTVAREAVERPAGGLQGIDVEAAAFVDPSAFLEAVRAGLPGEVVKQTVAVVGYRGLVLRLVGTASANLHRVYRRKALAQAQSEALLDALRVFARAERAFAGLVGAREWLETALPVLGGQRPIDLCDTFEGRRLVQDAIRRIEHGEFP